MERVKDMYPEEIKNCDNPCIRAFKISEKVDFKNPLEDTETGKWQVSSPDTIMDFSAAAYFFAKELNRLTGIPVGFIDASLGGSKIHCWMSRQMLSGYDDRLAEADRYADDAFRESVLRDNIEKPLQWHKKLDEMDRGVTERWESVDTDDEGWDTISLPAFFRDTRIGNVLGIIYFRKSFDVPRDMAGREANLWLGTLVDSDMTYINGIPVGLTGYQYPPRKYRIPAGLLKEGKNNITVRLKVEYYLENRKGFISGGRFTPGKEYMIFDDENKIDLCGEWRYRIGATADREAPRQDFVSWKPVGLYNGMTAPCHRYTISGVAWYQGESDCEEASLYPDLFDRMVKGYREIFENDRLSFYVVQLPNFTIDNDPESEAWTGMRETLRIISDDNDDRDNIVTIDLGEDNDLHPQGKKELGRRLALLAAKHNCKMDIQCHGPVIKKLMCVKKGEGVEMTLIMDNTGAGMETRSANGRGSDGKVTDFIVYGCDGRSYRADVTVLKDRLLLYAATDRTVNEIRYCYAQTNSGALIYNSDGLPMSPGIYRF